MKNHREILENVIAKGGLFGICAKYYINNEQYATQYIIELSEQCHAENMQLFWGISLSNDILAFSQRHQSLNQNNQYDDDS